MSTLGPYLAAIPGDLVWLLLVGLFALFRWLVQKSGRSGDEPPKPKPTFSPQSDTGTGSGEEDRIRRFLEALGQPTSSKPPPKVKPRPQVQKPATSPKKGARPFATVLPPLTTVPSDVSTPPPLPSFQPTPTESEAPSTWIPQRVVPPRVSGTSAVPPEAPEPAARLSDPGLFPETVAASRSYSEITSLLRSQRSLRDAIILREVFGPPRGWQGFGAPELH